MISTDRHSRDYNNLCLSITCPEKVQMMLLQHHLNVILAL